MQTGSYQNIVSIFIITVQNNLNLEVFQFNVFLGALASLQQKNIDLIFN